MPDRSIKVIDDIAYGQYLIEVHFKKRTARPERIFQTMSGLISSFQQIDVDLARSVSVQIDPIVILEDIEIGSLRAKLGTLLKSVDDEALKSMNWKSIVGNYLVQGKRRIVEFLDDKDRVESGEQVKRLGEDLKSLAESTELLRIPIYRPVPQGRILSNLKKMGDVVAELEARDRAVFGAGGQSREINPAFRVLEEAVESILTKEVITSEIEMILKIKKPDYLGNSMWDFRHGDYVIHAKILDTEWLHSFQNRHIVLRPGDSMRARVRTEVRYDDHGEVVSTRHSVLDVAEIVTITEPGQLYLPEITDEEPQ